MGATEQFDGSSCGVVEGTIQEDMWDGKGLVGGTVTFWFGGFIEYMLVGKGGVADSDAGENFFVFS